MKQLVPLLFYACWLLHVLNMAAKLASSFIASLQDLIHHHHHLQTLSWNF
uniref:Uncharacterized protein n=1 Tax=Phakopsora pachyrhizi TaxID=170000 RepID=A0A0S1MJG7_PHAPC